MALFPFLLTLARSFFAPRMELMAEILALRQQLAIINRTGSVAKNILTTFYSGNEPNFATIPCVASEFLQQSPAVYRPRARAGILSAATLRVVDAGRALMKTQRARRCRTH
jgi:hypothetical protein